MNLEKIAANLRALQLYAHHAHNNCKGYNFFQDHEFLGEVYTAAESDYDSVVERMIGTSGKPVDTLALAEMALKLTSHLSKDPGECNDSFLRDILKIELSLCICIDKCIQAAQIAEGTRQLIGDIADRSMVRQYKLKQRVQK